MACCIGISTNPEGRINHWKRLEGYTHSRILAKGLTYSAAQSREAREASAKGCRSAPGGNPGTDRNRRVWSVYHVWGGR